MTVAKICENVRWCFDEEAYNGSDLAEATTDSTLMDNIIKSKIGDALRWICLFAPAEQLSGGDSSSSSAINIIVDDTGNVPQNGRIAMGDGFIRLIRVRCSSWHRAIMGNSLLKEDSDEYMQLMDAYGAEATVDRPQAALIESAEKKVEVWPHASGSTYELTKLVMPSTEDTDSLEPTDDINIPTLLEPSFIYYLAFLTLSAYEDSRSARMLEIAKMNLGMTDDKQRV